MTERGDVLVLSISRRCSICGNLEYPMAEAVDNNTWICGACCRKIRRMLSDVFSVNLMKAYEDRTKGDQIK